METRLPTVRDERVGVFRQPFLLVIRGGLQLDRAQLARSWLQAPMACHSVSLVLLVRTGPFVSVFFNPAYQTLVNRYV